MSKLTSMIGLLVEAVLIVTIVGIPIAFILYYQRKQLEILEKKFGE